MNYDLMRRLQEEPSEEHLWDMILSYQNIMFKTYSGLPFTYEVRNGRNGEYTKELWIDRREKSKSLAWSSVKLAFHNIKQTVSLKDLKMDVRMMKKASPSMNSM